MKRFVTFLLSFALIFGAVGITACDDNESGNTTPTVNQSDSTTPPTNQDGISDTTLVNDTAKAFSTISQYDGSYTLTYTHSLSESKLISGPFYPEDRSATSYYTSNGKYTYDETTKKVGITSQTKSNEYEWVHKSLYSYIPTENGYTEYACKNWEFGEQITTKTMKTLSQEEIEENVCTLPQFLSTSIGVDIEKAKVVESKEELVSLFQEGAKKLTAELDANISFSDYKAERVDELNKYTITYQINLSNLVLDGYTTTNFPSTNFIFSFYVKDEKLVKFEFDGTVSYTASKNTEGGTAAITYSRTQKSIYEVSYTYDNSIIPTDFSDYLPED